MARFFKTSNWLFFIPFIFVLFILAQSQHPTLGWDPASTPQSYLPVILKETTPAARITPTSTPTSTPANPTPQPSDWLSYLNWLRALGGIPPVIENTSWSTGCTHHAKYMVKNDYIGHSEDSTNPWYTQDGYDAAGSSNVMVHSSTGVSDIYAIDLWMSGPFHGVGIIDPALSASGFGSYREALGLWQMGACLDVIRGLDSIQPSVSFPLMWPGDGGSAPYTQFSGGEWPDPLSSCSGYSTPSGPPIFLQLGSGNQTPNVTDHSFQQGSTSLEHCVFDETSYTNPSGSDQSLGRSVLNMRDAIILIPRNPLSPGVTYTVSITNSGTAYTWLFTALTNQQLSVLDAEIR